MFFKRKLACMASALRGTHMYRLLFYLTICSIFPFCYYSYFTSLTMLLFMPYILGTLLVLTSLLVVAAFMPAGPGSQSDDSQQ